MKRIQFFLAGAFIAVTSLCAQSEGDWQSGVARVKELIKSNPAQAAEEAEQLVKGKNKKNVDLLVAIGAAYLNENKLVEAQEYVAMARKANGKSAAAALLAGDIALAKKDAGTACQNYEEAIFYDPKSASAYVKYADVYKKANPELSIEKLLQLKVIDPSNIEASRKLAEIYYLKNDYKKTIEAYSSFISGDNATETDLIQYAFVLFLDHDFDKSLEIANMGLKMNPRHAAFNRLAMFNNTDLKRYDEAMKAADALFNASDKADFSYLDYKYYGYLLSALKKSDEAIVQFEKAVALDSTQITLYKEISDAYLSTNDFKKSMDAYKKYMNSLEPEKKTLDVQFDLGKLYYMAGTAVDSLTTMTKEERIQSLKEADAIFAEVAKIAPDSHLGNFFRARTNSGLDPEATEGLAKPYYEEVAKMLEVKAEARYNSILIECYSYLGYYYYLQNKFPESKEYWNKILAIDPNNAVAKNALEGIK